MKTFDVLLTKSESAKVQIEAETAEEAEEIAFDRFMHCGIELEDSGIPGDVTICVTEAGGQVLTASGANSIYWSDLTPAKQAEILNAFGREFCYNVFPVAEIPIVKEDDAGDA